MHQRPSPPRVEDHAPGEHIRHALGDVKRRLGRSALRLAGFLLVVYVVLKLVPALKDAWRALEHSSWEWVLALLALEVVSEVGFVFAWHAILDPQNLLAERGGRRVDQHLAWLQLGGGLLLPGGSWGGMGMGALILRRFGMPSKDIAERQFNLSFLNTAIDALALVLFGLGLATTILPGERNLLLTLLPAALAGSGLIAAPLIAARLGRRTQHSDGKRAGKVASAIASVAAAVDDTRRLLFERGDWTPVLGILAYLGCDALVLWCAFSAVHANPLPGFPIVIMAYIIGALGGSVPLPAGAGTIGGIAGMLIAYGVDHNSALAAVLLHQSVALLVPVIGGGISYAVLRHRFGPMRRNSSSEPAVAQANSRDT